MLEFIWEIYEKGCILERISDGERGVLLIYNSQYVFVPITDKQKIIPVTDIHLKDYRINV